MIPLPRRQRPRGSHPGAIYIGIKVRFPFTGELFCLFLDLLADWGERGDERDAIWSDPGSVSLISTTLTNDDPRSHTIDGLGFDAGAIRDLDLQGLERAGSELFLHYRVRR